MSIESIGSSSGFNPAIMAQKMAQKMMTELDTNTDGSIDKKEFVTGLASKGVSQADAEEIFAELDETSSGKITQNDVENFMAKAPEGKPPEGMEGKPPEGMEGKPPKGMEGQPPPPPPSAETEDSESDSSADSTVYDKADRNKDGEVTTQEQLQYILTHLTEETLDDTSSSDSTVNLVV